MRIYLCGSLGCGEIGIISRRQIKELGSDVLCTCWHCGDDDNSDDDCLNRVYRRDCAAIRGYREQVSSEDDE